MRLRVMAAAAAVLTLGCGDALSTDVSVVARAGGFELGVGRLAEVIAAGKDLALRRDVVEGIAEMWIDYTLFAQSLVAGNTMLDSATVVVAKWADVQQELASAYHDMLIGDAAELDSAAVDSAYDAGEYRFIKQIFLATEPDLAEDFRQMKRQVVQRAWDGLGQGGPWSVVAPEVNSAVDGDAEGSLGVVARGEMMPALENEAYALQPGGVSIVIQTELGFHILYRPPLAEVRAAFAEGLTDQLQRRFDAEYLARLPATWNIKVRASAVPAVREVATDPIRAKRSGKVIGTFRGGEFTVADFARWIQGMPIGIRRQLSGASDDQIRAMVETLIRNDVLLREAREQGITLPPDALAKMTDQLARELSLLGAAMGLHRDTLAWLGESNDEIRRRMIEVKVVDYIEGLSQERGRLQLVPPFLADELRSRTSWEVVPAGVERVLERARALRAAYPTQPPDSAPAPAARPDSTAGGP
ncbi:MAG TPA: peptidylprolyl isomerase [Gemmatimonadales bacterium]